MVLALLVSVVALLGAAAYGVVWLTRGRPPRAVWRAAVLTLLAAWLNPYSQLALDEAAQRELCAQLNQQQGSTHAAIERRLGIEIEPPILGRMSRVTVKARPWYAPVGLMHVDVLFNPDGTLAAAYAND